MESANLQRGIGAPLFAAIIIAILAIGGIAYYASQPQVKETYVKNDENAMIEPEPSNTEKKQESEVMQGEPVMSAPNKPVADVKYAGGMLAGKSAPFLDFAKGDYDAAVKSDKLVALYFYANWCPICKEELPNALYPAFNELTSDRVIGFRINYNDSETDSDEQNLAREFGVAYQHTKVFLKNGTRVLKSPESWNKARYVSEINKLLGE